MTTLPKKKIKEEQKHTILNSEPADIDEKSQTSIAKRPGEWGRALSCRQVVTEKLRYGVIVKHWGSAYKNSSVNGGDDKIILISQANRFNKPKEKQTPKEFCPL